jgi:hypothetical protein
MERITQLSSESWHLRKLCFFCERFLRRALHLRDTRFGNPFHPTPSLK